MTAFTFVSHPADTAAAHALLRAERAARPPRDPRPLPERIAEAMQDIAATGATVDEDQLALRGFTSAELTAANLKKARDLANSRAVRRV